MNNKYFLHFGFYPLFLILLIELSIFLNSCSGSDIQQDELSLSGDISDKVPSYSWDLNCPSITFDKYIYFKAYPTLNANLDLWGLKISNIDYYIDNHYATSISEPPFAFNYKSDTLSYGTHAVKAKLTISGNNCEDLIMEKSKYFTAENSTYTPAGDFFIDYNLVAKGDTLTIKPILNIERSSAGCQIKKVQYKWNGIIMDTKSTSPFSWSHIITEDAGTQQFFTISISYIDGKNNYLNSYFSKEIDIASPDIVLHMYEPLSSSQIYSSKEAFKGIAKAYVGSKSKAIPEVTIEFDGKQIGKSSKFPYDFSYSLTNESLGLHEVKTTWTISHEDGYTSSSNESECILITK